MNKFKELMESNSDLLANGEIDIMDVIGKKLRKRDSLIIKSLAPTFIYTRMNLSYTSYFIKNKDIKTVNKIIDSYVGTFEVGKDKKILPKYVKKLEKYLNSSGYVVRYYSNFDRSKSIPDVMISGFDDSDKMFTFFNSELYDEIKKVIDEIQDDANSGFEEEIKKLELMSGSGNVRMTKETSKERHYRITLKNKIEISITTYKHDGYIILNGVTYPMPNWELPEKMIRNLSAIK